MRAKNRAVGLVGLGFIAGAVAFAAGASGGATAASATSRKPAVLAAEKTLSIAAITMVAHPECAPGACAPQSPGYHAVPSPGGGFGLLTGGGVYFAPVSVPPGSRLTRMTLVAFDNDPLPTREVHAALLADKNAPPNPISVSAVGTEGSKPVGYQTASARIKGPAALVRADRAYFVEVDFPDSPTLLPVMVQIRYRAPAS